MLEKEQKKISTEAKDNKVNFFNFAKKRNDTNKNRVTTKMIQKIKLKHNQNLYVNNSSLSTKQWQY